MPSKRWCAKTENLTDTNHVPSKRTAVALGLFDGLHSGHQDVIHKAVDFIPQGISPAIFTFETDTVTTKGRGGVDVILAKDLKHELLSRLGVEYIYSPDFLNFKELTAVEFVRLVLRDKLRAKYVICGDDFRFGKGALCGRKELEVLCAEHDITVIVIPPTIIDGDIVSSTRIRNHIRNGEIQLANRLLGYPFTLRLPVVHGNEIGRTMNFPTINQYFPKRQVVPRFGVYASTTIVHEKSYKSITNVGVKPTVGGETTPLAETNIFGCTDKLYGETIQISLQQFIRPETKFDSINELKEQLEKDVAAVKELVRLGKI
ncbi:MAG: bifunctional riboflavin kinase/FAD synthetase [Oscillospiraceae bacterium]